MNNNMSEKKAWFTPTIEEAPVQMTERLVKSFFTEDGVGRFDFLGEQPGGIDEPGGPS